VILHKYIEKLIVAWQFDILSAAARTQTAEKALIVEAFCSRTEL